MILKSIAIALIVTGVAVGAAAVTTTAAPTERAAPALRIEEFSPQHEIKAVRQVAVRFSVPMVALGDPRLADPFRIQCAAAGQGRWADGRNWVYDFEDDLPAGTRCQFTALKNLHALDGQPLVGKRSYSFNTGGPAILATLPREGSDQLDEDQVFVLRLDSPATPASIEAHASCVIDGVGERVPVTLLRDPERAAVLKQRAALGYDYFQLLWKNGRTSHARVRNRQFEQAESALVVLRCQRHLPPATTVRLLWGRGIASPSGLSTSQDQMLAYSVREAFTALVQCARTNARSGCIPIQPISVSFTSPIATSVGMAIRLRDRAGTLYAPTPATENPVPPTLESVAFPGPFPDNTQLSVLLPAAVVDDAGRPLQNAARFPLSLEIAEYPALAKFSGAFGILESREGGILPVTLRNLEPHLSARLASLPAKLLKLDTDPASVSEWLRRVESAAEPAGEWVDVPPATGSRDGKEVSRVWRENTGTESVFGTGDSTQSFTVEKSAGKQATEVVGIPLRGPGFYVVELQSRLLGVSLLGRDAVRYVSTAALVTNLSVHFKWGRESSRVWVTRLDTGEPVVDADVIISDYCSGVARWQGKTGRQGLVSVDDSLGNPHGSATCDRYSPSPLLVSVKKAGDFSFTQSGWDQGIDPNQFSVPVGNGYSADIFHTVLDRALFRAGETVSMTHFLRHHRMQGLTVAEQLPAVRKLSIVHQGSGQRYELTADFGGDGIAETQWQIPAEAKLGDYSLYIEDAAGQTLPSGTFKVEQFRLPSMRATATLPALPLVRPKEVPLDIHVAYLSGGGASGLAVKVRTVIEPQPRQIAGYDDYQFGGSPVQEGTRVDGTQGGDADDDEQAATGDPQDAAGGKAQVIPLTLDGDGSARVDGTQGGDADDDADEQAATGDPQDAAGGKAQVIPLTLDGDGSARVKLAKLPIVDVPSRLTAEVEYADANGELLTATSHATLVPSELTLGIRREGWVATTDQMRFRVVALDLAGKPRKGQHVAVALYQASAYSYRKRLIGGFYAYETSHATRKLPATCQGVSDARGIVACEVAPGATGEIIVRAETRDAQGLSTGVTSSMWVAGSDDWWFGGTSGDRMDVFAEKKEYQAGETARLQIRMPFRSATALVTVEREGVLSSFVTHLDGHAPVIDVPITDAYAPNVFVSVLAVRGRVARAESKPGTSAEEITALVDLNKPAYRLGLAEIKVGWKPHELTVSVQPDKKSYKVRDTAEVRVHVVRADGSPLPAGAEVTLAAVDEALLDLAPNRSWSLLEAMMGERGLEVWTSTAQMQVVGKRHYGRKAVAHGGGGGREMDRAREQFDSLLFWKGRQQLDAHGDATVRVPLNDSLSAFRLVAIAHEGPQRYGTGSATVVTTQDVILVSGLPPLVREADRFAATFTVRNTTLEPLSVDVHATVTPSPAAALGAQQLLIPAGGSRDVSWSVTAPLNAPTLKWQVEARVLDTAHPTRAAFDRLAVSQTVLAAFPVRTYQATIAQLSSPLTFPAARPAGAVPGRGGLDITVRAKLGDGLDGVQEYMRWYPYICLEQQLSQAVALRNRAAWDAMMARLPAYMDRDGLLKYFPTEQLEGDDTLSAYVLSVADTAGWTLGEGDKQQVLHALQRFVTGKLVRRSALPTADLAIRKLAALDALSRYGAADASMLDSISLEPNLWPTSAVLDWLGVLQRVADVPRAAERRVEALRILRSRLNFQGTTLGFSTERSDALWWLMISSDSNANRLLLAVMTLPEWREDIPRLVRGALGRQQEGHWSTTVGNAWGVLAMDGFSREFEATPVTGATGVRYGAAKETITWPTATGEARIELPWADGRVNLGVAHAGGGKPWVMVRATAALPLDKPLFTGFKIKRTVMPVEQQVPGVWTRGDVLRVHLELEAQSDMSWVVVDDPIPAGASILGSGLGGQSALATRGEKRTGWAWPAFEERRFDGYRGYYRFVPKGRWSTDYTLRLNNPGDFVLPATRVEAMYAPEMFGELPNAAVTVMGAPGHP